MKESGMRDSLFLPVYYVVWLLVILLLGVLSWGMASWGLADGVYVTVDGKTTVLPFFLKALRALGPSAGVLALIISLSRVFVRPGVLFLSILELALLMTGYLYLWYAFAVPPLKEGVAALEWRYTSPVSSQALVRTAEDRYLFVYASGRFDAGVVDVWFEREPVVRLFQEGWFDEETGRYVLGETESIDLSRRYDASVLAPIPGWASVWEEVTLTMEEVWDQAFSMGAPRSLLFLGSWFLFSIGMWTWVRFTRWPFFNTILAVGMGMTPGLFMWGVKRFTEEPLFVEVVSRIPLSFDYVVLGIPAFIGLCALLFLLFLLPYARLREEVAW